MIKKILYYIYSFIFSNKLLRKVKTLFNYFKVNKQVYFNNINDLVYKYIINTPNTTALDIGSGPEPRNIFNSNKSYGVDIRGYPKNNVFFGDLTLERLPFDDEMFDYVTAFDVLEHIPRTIIKNDTITIFPFINLMNEIFRVLKYKGIFFNLTPAYPFKEAFQDPTHVNIITEDTMELYFCEKKWARIYGFNGSFNMLKDGWIGKKYFSILMKDAKEKIENVYYEQK